VLGRNWTEIETILGSAAGVVFPNLSKGIKESAIFHTVQEPSHDGTLPVTTNLPVFAPAYGRILTLLGAFLVCLLRIGRLLAALVFKPTGALEAGRAGVPAVCGDAGHLCLLRPAQPRSIVLVDGTGIGRIGTSAIGSRRTIASTISTSRVGSALNVFNCVSIICSCNFVSFHSISVLLGSKRTNRVGQSEKDILTSAMRFVGRRQPSRYEAPHTIEIELKLN